MAVALDEIETDFLASENERALQLQYHDFRAYTKHTATRVSVELLERLKPDRVEEPRIA